MNQRFSEVENTDPEQHRKWLEKHGFKPAEDGTFKIDGFEGKNAATPDELLQNIRQNVSSVDYEALFAEAFDERTFVMVCGGPSLEEHLGEIRKKSLDRDNYLVVCSNMTGWYLLENGITPHAHFIIDPQEKKRFDVAKGKTSPQIQYWINAACHPAVFAELKAQGIRPFMFLADFDAEGKAIQAVKDSLQPGQSGMMAIQGGTMAGLRAMNLADALGFRRMEYYGFDATVRIKEVNGEKMAQPYAYEKKRGEAIIEVSCDRCPEKFDTTLIFQGQVNEFLAWHSMMPWLQVEIIGGGLVAHAYGHLKELQRQQRKSEKRFTEGYATLQRELHAKGNYGTAGVSYITTIFHAIAQLAKRHGAASVLDYGSSSGRTMKAVKEHMWLPPSVTDRCYDPFVDEFAGEPECADLVICTDVMEHVEPECTDAVLDHITRLTKRIAFFSIGLTPAMKVLSDGRNAHINLRSSEFWLKEIKRRFIVSEAKVSADGGTLLVVGQSIDDVRQEIGKRNAIAA